MAIELRRVSSISPVEQRWLWASRIPYGEITIIEGDPATNKSTLLCDLAARISRGREMPQEASPSAPGSVLLFSAEDSPSRLQQLLEGAGADLERVLHHHQGAQNSCAFPRDCRELEAHIREAQARLVVFDPISPFLNGGTNSERHVRAALRALGEVAARTGTAIVLLRHLTKSAQKALYRGGGSLALGALARSVLVVGVDPSSQRNRVIASVKNNLGPPPPSLVFTVHDRGGTPQLQWLGQTHVDAEALSGGSESGPTLQEAMFVLYSILGEGPVPSADVNSLASAQGVSRRTLRRAKEQMGIIWTREGFGPGSRIVWRLPDDNPIVQAFRQADMDQLFNGGRRILPSSGGPEQPVIRRVLWRDPRPAESS